MSWFNDLKIARKLTVGFGAVLVLTVTVGVFGLWRTQQVGDTGRYLATAIVPSVQASEELNAYMSDFRTAELELINAASPKQLADAEKAFEVTFADIARAKKVWAEAEHDASEKAAFTAWTADWETFLKTNAATLAMARAGKRDEAIRLAYGAEVAPYEAAMDKIEAIIADKIKDAAAAEAQAQATVASARIGIIGVVIVALLVGIVVATAVARRLSAGILTVAKRAEQLRGTCTTNLSNALDALARGDLDARAAFGTPKLQNTDKDELGELSRTVDGMIDQSVAAIHAFTKTSTTLATVIRDTQILIEQAKDGKLAERADAQKFEGGFRELVSAANQMLDAVVEPLNEASSTLQKVAARDLTARMEGDYANDLLTLKTALNTAVENLEMSLAEIAGSAEQVSAASGQIATGSQALAQGTSEQASSLEEVSASLQEMSSMSKQNTGNATEARSLTESARSTAARGVDSMRRLTDAINRIKSSSDSTAKIVKTIDEIAFQTNLLALNAAVEAARAGDAGRGFAVVAEEVRNLAMRSAEAAKNTSTLIEESVHNAMNGVALNDEVLANLQEIDAQVNKVGEVMAEIAAASEQQNQGVDQITTAIEQVNTVTQSAAANSEESAAASEELSGQAEQMRSLVGSFRIRGGRPAAARPEIRPVNANAAIAAAPVSKPVVRKAPPARPVVKRTPSRPVMAGSTVGNGNGEGLYGSKGIQHSAAELAIPFNDEGDEQILGEF